MKTNSQRVLWSRAHDTLAVFALDDFENRLESSNNREPHWKPTGYFLPDSPALTCLLQAIIENFHLFFAKRGCWILHERRIIIVDRYI